MPSSRHQFTDDQTMWLIDHAGGIENSVDMWAYRPEFDDLLVRFNRQFRTTCGHNAMLDHLVRRVEKKRYVTPDDQPKLTKFARRRPQKLPEVSDPECAAVFAAYVREDVPRDRLAYTPQFDRIVSAVPRLTHRQVWHWLLSMGKRGSRRSGFPLLRKTRVG